MKKNLIPLDDRGPLRVMFLITSMPVGGAETLLLNLVRRMDRERFLPSLGCLKQLGPLGALLAQEIPAYSNIIKHKHDVVVVRRLAKILRQERIDAIVTVGAGDKMFWGRLAARYAQLPVVLCALHSTGWPDSIGKLNRLRLMTRWTDGFIGVAQAHAEHLRVQEAFPAEKVFFIPNGVDIEKFHPSVDGTRLRQELRIGPEAPVAGIVAALRPEKNHEAWLRVAAQVLKRIPAAKFLIVGDGPLRAALEEQARTLDITQAVHFLGNRSDVPEVLAAMDAMVLTSKMEANPVSILEAMAAGRAVVAPNVGSIAESVIDGQSGILTRPMDEQDTAQRLYELLSQPELARGMGQRGRDEAVAHWSLDRMVDGYQELIADIYRRKAPERRLHHRTGAAVART